MEECTICLEPLKTDITILRCLHKFHTGCILKYKYRHKQNFCPICRRKSIFLSRCNVEKNEDNTLSYTEFKETKNKCCNIM